MKLRTFVLIITTILMLGLASTISLANTGTPDNPLGNGISSGSDSWSGNGSLMQDDGEEPADNEDGDDGDDGEGSDDEEASGDEGTGEEGSEEEPAEDESGDEEAPEEEPAPGMSDVMAQPMGAPAEEDPNLQDALAGIRDYDVPYNTSISHAENTPQVLRDLDVEFAGDESLVAARTQALWNLNLLDTLSDRYAQVEEQYAADPYRDFDQESDRTLNYFQPREDPFVITSLIPDELRPELEGTGLDGAVDPELLEQLFWAQYTANLRLIPIIIVGTIEVGPRRMVMYTIYGWGSTSTISVGETQCVPYSPSFSITCSQASETFVVFSLRGYYDRRCRQAATGTVMRTFHTSTN